MTDRLRITGGSHRGRKLLSPPRGSIRPASDFVRQAIFNMLARFVENSLFYDVFAGTGIVGIEALSRGSKRAIFVERDRRQLDLIRRNLDRTRFGPEAALRGVDAFSWARHFRPDEEPTIVFLGPPYEHFHNHLSQMLELVEMLQDRLADREIVDAPSGKGSEERSESTEFVRTLVLQFPRTVGPEKLPDFDRWYRLKQYGKTRIGIWRPQTERASIVTETTEHEPIEAEDGATVG